MMRMTIGNKRVAKILPKRLKWSDLSLWTAVAVGLVVRLWLAWQPIATLVARYNADDAYYYFTIARHIAQGQGATFDGLAPTNGFHPLYLLLLVPLFWFSPDNLELNVHLGLSLVALFNVLTAFPLYWTLKRLASPRASLVGVIAWLFGPGVIAIVLEGVESGVYVFFVAVTVYLYVVHQTASADSSSNGRLFRLGIALGMTILARSDGILLLAAILFDMVIRRVPWRAIAMSVAACGLVLAPWVAWNLATFGTMVQASGAAILYASQQGSMTVGQALGSFGVMVLSAILLAFPCLVVVLFIGIAWIDFRFRRGFAHRTGWPTGMRHLLFLFLYVLLLFAFYAWVLRHRQNWYLLPALFAIALITGWLFDLFRSWLSRRSPQLTTNLDGLAIALLLTSFVLISWVWESNGLAMHPTQAGGYRIAQWLAQETEPQTRVGAWNSGIIGYFSRRTVVNLDGVVNNELLKHVTSQGASFDLKGEWDYIQSTHITYVTDYENVLNPLVEGELAEQVKVEHELPGVKGLYPLLILRISDAAP